MKAYNSRPMKDKDRRAMLVSMWRERPRDKRTGNDLFIFYGELEKTHPELLKRDCGDPYQQLKVDLSGQIVER